ncbi:hypothetical protein GSI_12575 [Ganoderma sinense ZZ0214-1]|uniref:Uncharacterized protein n=1 Tax=Ganoderma sinense ZZ0214-1 TaxID=1077348 RepID=A0A2G8RT59_9APHY|nr:hypothetical protein GSI_12575 [Ganoderma sinense ZZ0214-1]
MDSPASRLTPLEDDVPFPFDRLDSESVSEAITTRSRSRKRAATAVEPEPRPTKKPRRGKKSEPRTPNEPSGSGDGSSQTQTQRMTAQAERRRADLLRDPHASMIDMYNVQCLKCGVKIKLSLKGLYDLHHWEKHRKRCNKWSDAYAAKKRAENCIESSRLSTPPPTPPLTEDFGTEFTETSARSTSLATPSARSPTPEVAAKAAKKEDEEPIAPTGTAAPATDDIFSPAPPPPPAAMECWEERRRECPPQLTFVLSSHTQSAAAMALLHPDLEVFDLNKPLPEVPRWSWADVKPGTTVYRCTEWGRGSVLLSSADWDDPEEHGSACAAGEE